MQSQLSSTDQDAADFVLSAVALGEMARPLVPPTWAGATGSPASLPTVAGRDPVPAMMSNGGPTSVAGRGRRALAG
jgi:hypothetical protein